MRIMRAIAVAGLVLVVGLSAEATSVFQAGGDRLDATQNPDGGWGWPVAGASAPNTVAPITMGLIQAYRMTGDPDHLSAIQQAGAFLLTKTNNFSPSDGYLAAELDGLLGGTTYRDHVQANFYGPLAAGTYNRLGLGTLYSTASFVDKIRTDRAAQGIPNMAAWDIGIGVVGAASAGADPSAWVAGTKAEINELSSAAWYDVLGLAGGVYGLAFVGEDFDPTAGQHAAAGSLADLAAILAGYQLPSGGFTWNANFMGPGDETVQETAYAVLALNEFNRPLYATNLENAAEWLIGFQLPNGGWQNYTGGGENNVITGEALWGTYTAVPEPVTVAGLAMGLGVLARYVRRRTA